VRSAHLALLLAAAACSQGGSARPTADDSGGGGPAPADLDPRCAKVEPHVRALYLKARDPSTEDRALADDLLAANVAMVMNDCRADPQRVAPCAERAADAAELERSCLIPLDDEGAVDGDRLLKGT
jgi:hypothetical protein